MQIDENHIEPFHFNLIFKVTKAQLIDINDESRMMSSLTSA